MNDRIAARTSFERALAQLRAGDAGMAERTCRTALADFPQDSNLSCLLGACLRRQSRLADAERVLRDTIARTPGYAKAHEELGAVLLLLRKPEDSRAHLERALALDPRLRGARLKLSSALVQCGEVSRAQATLEKILEEDPTLQVLREAAELIVCGRLEQAERAYRSVLAREPDQVDALRGLGNVAARAQRYREAVALLSRVVAVAPDFAAAWSELGHAQLELDEYEDALGSIRRALALEPQSAMHQLNLGNVLARAGQQAAAIEALERALSLEPAWPAVHLALGNVLKTIGRQADAVAAYRRSVELRPDFAEGYWSLSNLKTFGFTDAEIAAMQAHLELEDLEPEAAVHFSFALGQALERRGEYARAFQCFLRGNTERRRRERYDPVQTELVNDRIVELFDASFLEERAGLGDPDVAPIFIVGLPRSGSTLIEQILASHSMVEGTHELPSLGRVVQFVGRARSGGPAYPEALLGLEAGAWAGLGRRYLEHTRRYRRGAPRFIDKMPNNFPNVGLVHLILPNARVIDARRDALDTCVSCYKQLFAQGQSFSYDLLELGEYYLQYLRMMAHWDKVLPGRVLRVQYEDVVSDLEGQTRRILEYCDLPWEDACLHYYDTARAVRTASSEQVRRPIYTDSIGVWKPYAQHLQGLMETLGIEPPGQGSERGP